MATIKIPESICLAIVPSYAHDPNSADMLKQLRTAIKAMIESAITDDLSPAALPSTSEGGASMNITFAAKEDKAIRYLARVKSIREGDAALMFLYSALARGDGTAFRQETLGFMSHYTAAIGKESRHHQNIFAEYLASSLGSTQIGLIEAATGVGKTLAIIAACIETLKGKTFGRIVVAVPTIQLLRQFAKQMREIESSGLPDIPPARFILGRAEFVCVSELRALISKGTELADPAPILAWITAGGPPGGEAKEIDSSYLLASLRHLSPSFPAEAVRLSMDSEPDDPGAQSYAAQFARMENVEATCEIIFCTHAMVAADVRRRMQTARRSDVGQDILAETRSQIEMLQAQKESSGDKKQNNPAISDAIALQLNELVNIATALDIGLLPPWQHIVIDEAHAFESNLANLMAASVSLGRYIRHLEELSDAGIISKAASARARKALNLIRNNGRQDDYDLTDSTPVANEFRAALQEMATAFLSGRKPTEKHPLLAITRVQANTILSGVRAAAENRGNRTMLTYSPIRAFPQLNVGRQSVQTELNFLWQSATSGACVSATLYLRKLDKDSASYTANVLRIPPTRQQEFPIIRPAWVHEPVLGLWIPEAVKLGDRYWLRPPSRRDRLAPDVHKKMENVWLDEIAEALKAIYDSSEGGVLVLMGSYSATEALSNRMSDYVELKVVASQKHSLHEQMTSFATYGASGRKAMWIAVGGAWTGVDINGENYGIKDPSKDNLITDLVIPRLPFGLNRSMTHRTRIDAMSGIPWELLDTTLRFKQGLGRLVRRPDLPKNRRIFVLDGRCNDPAFENYLSHLQRVMGIYPRKTFARQ